MSQDNGSYNQFIIDTILFKIFSAFNDQSMKDKGLVEENYITSNVENGRKKSNNGTFLVRTLIYQVLYIIRLLSMIIFDICVRKYFVLPDNEGLWIF